MTEPTTTDTAKPATKRTTKKSTAVKPEFAPKVTDKGRLDHSDCGHPRTLAGRNACRAAYAKAAEAATLPPLTGGAWCGHLPMMALRVPTPAGLA